MSVDIRSLGKNGKQFSNWAKTYSCTPELYFEPESTDEIKQILHYASEKGKKVKTVGCGHSPSDLACTTDFMISLARYNKVLKVDKEKLQVTVQGGCQMKDLNEIILPSNGMAFSVQGAVSDLTAAGVISTGTHGSGANFPNISAFVVNLEIMLASGEIMRVSQTVNAELLPVVSLSLGSVGVILSVTFQCEKAFNLHCKQHPDTLNNVIKNLDPFVDGCEHFRFMWYPRTDSVVCYTVNRTKQIPDAKTRSSWFWDVFVGYHLFQIMLWISTFIPLLVPFINRLHFAVFGNHVSEKIARSDLIFNFDCLFKQYVMEWAVPRNKTGVVLLELRDWIENNDFPAHLPIEVRFVKGDNNYLSPCYQQDSCYINIIMYRPFNKFVPHEAYWTAYQTIMAKHGGRPHWAKDHKFSGAEFQSLYPKWKEFCQAREKLDPNGMFLNSNLERVFGMKPSNTSYVM